jgi:hypothetical protein
MAGPRSYKPLTSVRFTQLGPCSRKHLVRLPGCLPDEAGSIPVDCANASANQWPQTFAEATPPSMQTKEMGGEGSVPARQRCG